MSAEEQLTKVSNRITRMSTVLLMIAVIAYFFTLLFFVMFCGTNEEGQY